MGVETLPVVNCFTCNTEVPTTEIRQHQAQCRQANEEEEEVARVFSFMIFYLNFSFNMLIWIIKSNFESPIKYTD